MLWQKLNDNPKTQDVGSGMKSEHGGGGAVGLNRAVRGAMLRR